MVSRKWIDAPKPQKLPQIHTNETHSLNKDYYVWSVHSGRGCRPISDTSQLTSVRRSTKDAAGESGSPG